MNSDTQTAQPGTGVNIESVSLQSLADRTVYVPQMSVEASALLAASFRSVGIDAQVYPDSDSETLTLGEKYTSGDECYPLIITLGNFCKILEDEEFDPEHTAFLFAGSAGPCRFGQYLPFIKKVMRDMGYPEIPVFSIRAQSGYNELMEKSLAFQRTAWRAIVCGDILRKFLLQTRPYEKTPGETDRVHGDCLNKLCEIVEVPDRSSKQQLQEMRDGLEDIRNRFRKIDTEYVRGRPLIGVVGEIFCRLEGFANNDLIRAIERNGGEVWLANIGEWVSFTNFMNAYFLRLQGKQFSKAMLKVKLREFIQHRDEKKLYATVNDDFKGYETPEDLEEILSRGFRYLPYTGARGEMTMSVGTSLYLYEKGADGIIDISPFTCMNGIVTEAIYPKISRDHNNFPMRVFYFDGTETNLDRDVSIFLDLARTYKKKKRKQRVYPAYFYP